MMYWYGDHMSGWGYAIGIIGMILFWAVIIAAVVLIVRYFTSGRGQGRPPTPPPGPGPSSAEQMLAERFARGEIDDEEYRRRLEVLRTPSHT